MPPGCKDCAESRARVEGLQEELGRVEAACRREVARLEEELAKAKEARRELENTNQRLRLRKVGSRVRGGGRRGEVVSHKREGGEVEGEGADSGFRTSAGSGSVVESEDEVLDSLARRSISSTIYAALCQGEEEVPAREYSAATSLESSVSLVSATTATTAAAESEVVTNGERGTREKRFPDGRLEVWYANGNRKEVSLTSF